MKKILLLMISALVGVQGVAQQTLKGYFKIKPATSKVIRLEKIEDNVNETLLFFNKPCGYTDTTTYWTFRKQDSLKIETVIRKCNLNPDTSRNNKIEEKDGYSVLRLSTPEIRTSFWEEETGYFQLKDNYLEIKGTKKYNGVYLYTFSKDKKTIKLKRKNKK